MRSLIPQDISFNKNSVIRNNITDENLSYQNGEYKVTSSSISNSKNDAFNAFDIKKHTFWQCNYLNQNKKMKYTQDPYNGFVPSSYVGGGTKKFYWKTIANNKEYVGEWIQISLPYSSYLAKYSIVSNKFPRKFHLFGSNDSSSWELLDSQSLHVDYSNKNHGKSFNVTTMAKFNKFRLVISQLFKGTNASINEFKLFGNQNILVNIKSMENYSNYSDYRSCYTKKNSPYYSMEYKAFSKFDTLEPTGVSENFTSFREPYSVNDINIKLKEYKDKSNVANSNYGNLVTGITSYVNSRNDLLNSSLYDYSGNILFLNDGKKTAKDELEKDTKEYQAQVNNVYVLGAISLSILILGTIVILRN